MEVLDRLNVEVAGLPSPLNSLSDHAYLLAEAALGRGGCSVDIDLDASPVGLESYFKGAWAASQVFSEKGDQPDLNFVLGFLEQALGVLSIPVLSAALLHFSPSVCPPSSFE